MNTWECRVPGPLLEFGVSPPSYSTYYTEGSAECRSPLPGLGMSTTSSPTFSAERSAECRSPLPGFGVSPKKAFSRRRRRREKQNGIEGVLAKTNLELFVIVESF